MCDKLFVIFWFLFGTSALAATFRDLSTEDKFQSALEKQTFQTILTSIAERLKNLDNIYSIQLSQTLESKLESYHRKIESLDAKLVRLESLIMMNLDKISENMSTKNYKDDVVKTNTFRKFDFLYEGLNHRLNYVDRKNEAAYGKIQEKIDLLMVKLDKMEENMALRSLDIDVELSEALQFTEDLQTTTINVENLVNMTSKILNQTSNNIIHASSDDSQKIIEKLQKLEGQSQDTLNITTFTEHFLKEMKIQLTDDFNSYANKVADMNSYFWTNNEIINQEIKSLETVVNHTRTELKNGVRALMVQVGKKHGKDFVENDETIDSLKKDLEEVLSSQKMFLESCYKVQSDESQIESEISETLEKLIDLFQDKMKLAMKDIKSLDKTIKSHDQRMGRIFYQANTNIVNLFDRTVRGDEKIEKDVTEVKSALQTILNMVQTILSETTDDVILGKESVNQIFNIITELNMRSYLWITKGDLQDHSTEVKNELTNEIGKIARLLSNNIPVIDQLTKNVTTSVEHLGANVTSYQNLVNQSFKTITGKLEQCLTDRKNNRNESNFEYVIMVDHNTNKKTKTNELMKARNCTHKYDKNKDIKGALDDLEIVKTTTLDENETSTEQQATQSSITEKPTDRSNNCSKQYSDLIDIRGDVPDCVETETLTEDSNIKKIKENELTELTTTETSTETSRPITQLSGKGLNCSNEQYTDMIDIRADLCNEIETTSESEATQVNSENEFITETSAEVTTLKIGINDNNSKQNCTQQYSDLIDLRTDLCTEIETTTTTGIKTVNEENMSQEVSDDIKQAIFDIFGAKAENDNDKTSINDNEGTDQENNILSTTENYIFQISTEQAEINLTVDETIFNIDLRHDPDPV